ncbi:hypothetical protein ACMD2_14546 [Ananas comosus]|uniref:Uncharacterized protein n=1 Tax=Ananas comosus TaxID=4615 RepID=A0A199W062_ANACO|nr:hypothetical protein ACMD2_14546 [Ananas comosus]
MEASKERREAEDGGSNGQQQQQQAVRLPMESSPYVRYNDLEEYKLQGYGTSGHQPPVERPHHGGGTDAPTLSGSGLPERLAHATDHGVDR